MCLLKQQDDLREGGLARAEAAGPGLSAHSSSLASRGSNRLLIAPLFPSHRKPLLPQLQGGRPVLSSHRGKDRAGPLPGQRNRSTSPGLRGHPGCKRDQGARGMAMLSGEGSGGQVCSPTLTLLRSSGFLREADMKRTIESSNISPGRERFFLYPRPALFPACPQRHLTGSVFSVSACVPRGLKSVESKQALTHWPGSTHMHTHKHTHDHVSVETHTPNSHTNTQAFTQTQRHTVLESHVTHARYTVLKRHTILLNDVRGTLLEDRHVCQDGHNLEKRIGNLKNGHPGARRCSL